MQDLRAPARKIGQCLADIFPRSATAKTSSSDHPVTLEWQWKLSPSLVKLWPFLHHTSISRNQNTPTSQAPILLDPAMDQSLVPAVSGVLVPILSILWMPMIKHGLKITIISSSQANHPHHPPPGFGRLPAGKTSGAAPQPPLFASRSLNSRLNDSADAAGMIPLKLARIRYGKRSLIHALDFRLDHPTQRSPGNVASCCCKKDETCKHAVLCSFLKGFRPGNVGKSPKIEQCFHPLSN